MYDEVDVRWMYRQGFWHGALAGGLGVFLLCLAVGYYMQ